MGNLMDSVADYFTHDGWEFIRHDDEKKISMGVTSDHGKWPCLVSIDEEEKVVFFHSICPLKIPLDKRVKMAEFLTRVNRLCFMGSFVMDFDSGEIRFETYVFGNEETVASEQLEVAVGRNIAMMDKHIEAIAKVMSSDITPAEAVAELVTGMPMDKRYIYN